MREIEMSAFGRSEFRRLQCFVVCLASTCAWTTLPAAEEEKRTGVIRVAIYDDAGGSGNGPANLEKCLKQAGGFSTQRVKAEDIRQGALDRFDVLIQPGGSGSKQAETLGETGRAAIRKFVEGGGGYLGICAGAYLASADYKWSLGILDAKVLDRKHWARGNGDVRMRLIDPAPALLGSKESVVTVVYAQGPLLAPGGKPEIPDYETLATFETEIAKNGAPEGVMKGTTAAARAPFAQGRVFCFSPHPERSPGLEPFIAAAARWAAQK